MAGFSDLLALNDSITGLAIPAQVPLDGGVMTHVFSGVLPRVVTRYDWTNAMVVALGAVTSANILLCTLAPKVVVTNAYIVINSAETSANALTVSCGRTSAAYVDFIAASDAKAAANTVYGATAGARGANLTGYYVSSFTAATAVNAQFVKTSTNLNTCTASSGSVYLETVLLP